ncbi:hypothetical protein [Halorubrum yunnanense]|uniref:Uncharacterized protein n=1 Tax=Halorubrum yunnanense TaxID=1526162 RepID=A0ABD5YEM9_9EURY|nr:hypothetical protein [Halorubrum yunnanense]
MVLKARLAVLDALSTDHEVTPEELSVETEYLREHLYDVLDELLAGTCGSSNQRRVRFAEHLVIERIERSSQYSAT